MKTVEGALEGSRDNSVSSRLFSWRHPRTLLGQYGRGALLQTVSDQFRLLARITAPRYTTADAISAAGKMLRLLHAASRSLLHHSIRSVDELLRSEFGLTDGLADTRPLGATWSKTART